MPNPTVTQPVSAADAAVARPVRNLAKLVHAPPAHWVGDGFHVHGYFSADPDLASELSPFVLIDYHAPYRYAPTRNARRGVGPHPHRGFETVTLAFEGSVAHHDSAGHGGVIGPGDVQWMTAASGILHREYHEESFARRGGTMHMAQLWVNLPRAHKMSAPGYQAIESAQIGEVRLPDGAGLVRVIAGEYAGVRGPARSFTKVHMYEVRLNAGGRAEFAFPAHYNSALLVMSGPLVVNGEQAVATRDLALMDHAAEGFSVQAQAAAHLLLLAGEPIDEPIVQYGPFVMNTRREIQEAVDDFNRGAFGELAE